VVLRLPARVRSEAGAELVEFALVLPLLLLIFGGIVDFGLLLQRQQVVTNAAREGARLAVLPGYTTADVQARVTQFVREGMNNATATPTTVVTPVTITPGSRPANRRPRSRR
jgi:Flp pilus assembly protein TadG